MYEILFHKNAQKQLEKLPKEMQIRIVSVLDRIKISPHSYVKRLVNTPYFRVRVGDYRIIIDIQSNKLIIFVIEISHRKNVYD
ncbi:MAG: type II toxin-antitoxin system RelE/ParE family toxin [archaeon]